MNPENESVIKDIVGSLRKLVRAVSLDSQKMSRQFGLTGPQSVVLRLLLNKGSMSSAELSRLMYVTASNMTGIIDRLGEGIPDPIEKKFINQLADLELEHVQLLAMALNQILNLIDAEDIEAEPLDISPETLAVEQEEIRP